MFEFALSKEPAYELALIRKAKTERLRAEIAETTMVDSAKKLPENIPFMKDLSISIAYDPTSGYNDIEQTMTAHVTQLGQQVYEVQVDIKREMIMINGEDVLAFDNVWSVTKVYRKCIEAIIADPNKE